MLTDVKHDVLFFYRRFILEKYVKQKKKHAPICKHIWFFQTIVFDTINHIHKAFSLFAIKVGQVIF